MPICLGPPSFAIRRRVFAPAGESLSSVGPEESNQRRGPNVHPCIRRPSASATVVAHHPGILKSPNRRSPDWHVSRPGMRKRATAGARGHTEAHKCMVALARCRMPACVQCQSGDRRFGVLKTPERRTHRVEGLCVRRHGWTLGPLSWLLLSGPTERSDSPAGANTRRSAASDPGPMPIGKPSD